MQLNETGLGRRLALTHLDPKKGGAAMDPMVPACSSHNLQKGRKVAFLERLGLLKRQCNCASCKDEM